MYVARIVGPSGTEWFLCRGRRVDTLAQATKYPHPSSARAAIERAAWLRHGFFVDVIDPDDPERKVA